MSRHALYLSKGREFAALSHFRVRMGAVVVRQRRIIGAGTNVMKSHPIMNKPGNFFRCIHAEIAACLNAPRDGLRGSDVYVARILKNGNAAMAKPCGTCDALLSRFGVRRAFYTIDNNTFGEVRYGKGFPRYI